MEHPNLTEAKKRIEKANQSASKKLDFYGLRLTNVPEEVWKLTNLTILNLHTNQLRSLPEEIGRLANLTILDLSYNQLVRLPSEIGFLTKLTTLCLSNNQLRSLPEEFGSLTNLTYLSLHNNKELIYPPYSMIKSFNVAKKVLEFCQTHPNVFTRRGRRKNMWKTLQLMYIAQVDSHCSETFGKLPTEVLNLIEYFAISEPYIESKKRKRKE